MSGFDSPYEIPRYQEAKVISALFCNHCGHGMHAFAINLLDVNLAEMVEQCNSMRLLCCSIWAAHLSEDLEA